MTPAHHTSADTKSQPGRVPKDQQKRQIIQRFIERNFLVSEDLLDSVTTEEGVRQICRSIEEAGAEAIVCLNKDVRDHIRERPSQDIDWKYFERTRAALELTNDPAQYEVFLRQLASIQQASLHAATPTAQTGRQETPRPAFPPRVWPSITDGDQQQQHDDISLPPVDGPHEEGEHQSQVSNVSRGAVEVLVTHEDEAHKRGVQDFISFFNHRYKALRNILQSRRELADITSISRLSNKGPRSSVAIIGIVADKAVTRNENIILTIEDPTGTAKVLINTNKQDLTNIAKECVLDEVVGIAGTTGDGIIFANAVVLPDVPVTKELKKSPDEAYAVFLSDVHVGSNNFLVDEFNKFLQWIRGEAGSDAQRDIARKVKYIFIVGDLVDGVGIYPGQEKELAIKDIYGQYEEFARLIRLIPKDKTIIIGPGNHDAVRLAEPQPRLDENFAKPLYELENVLLVSNPAYVNIHRSEGFPGFDVLMYHGYSFDYFVANIDTIRSKGGYDRIDLLMTFLLQRRHLAPTHTSTLYIPDTKKDPLVIDMVPDIFVTGHIHKAVMASYRNITLISGSCWQATTAFQEKVGHRPEPARVPLVNLHTRQMKMMRFGDD